MLDIPLFVLVLQIGLNSAFNIHSHHRKPSPRSLYARHTRQTRREDSGLYQPSHSRSYESDSDYSNDEDDHLRELPLLPPRSYKTRKDYLRYSTPEYETTLEAAPLSKPRVNNYVKRSLQSPGVRRRYWNREDHAPYLQQRAPSFSQPQRRNSGIKDVLTSYADSLKVTKQHEDKDNILQSLISLIGQLGSEDKTRKYNRKGDILSLDEESVETLDTEEDIDSSLESFGFNNMRSYYLRHEPSYKRQNYRKGYNTNRYNLQIRKTPPAKDTSDEADAILVTDDSKPYDVVTIARPKSKKSDSIINRNDNHDSDTEDVPKYRKKGNLPYFSGLNHILKRSKHYTENQNDMKDISRELSINAKLLRDNDHTDQFTKLRMESLGENLDSLHGNKKPKVNFLRFMVLPQNKLTLSSELATNLTNLLSSTFDKLNLKPYVRTVVDTSYNDDERYNSGAAHGFSQNVNLRSYDDFSLVKRLLVDEAESNLVPYHESKDYNNQNKEVESIEEFVLETDDDKDEVIVGPDSLNIDLPILEINSSALRTDLDTEELASKIMNILQLAISPNVQLSIEKDNIANEPVSKQNNKTIDTSDELSPDDAHNTDFTSLRTDEQMNDVVSSTEKLHLEYPWNGQLSPNEENKNNSLRTEKSENVTDEHFLNLWNDQLNSDKEYEDNTLRTQNSEDLSSVLHLEYPWTDELSTDSENISNDLRTQQPQEYTHELQLEYPWTDQLSSDNENDNNSLRIQKPTDKTVSDAADLSSLLEFPWNGKPSPDKDNVSATLRTHLKNFTDVLHRENPLNDGLSPDNTNNAFETEKSLTDKQVSDTVDSNNELHLEYPWNNELSTSKNNESNTLRTENAQTNKDIKDAVNSTSELHLEYPKEVKDAVNSTSELHLEYPWNDQSSPDNDTASLRTQNLEDSTDVLHLDYPWNGQLESVSVNNTLRSQKPENSTNALHLEFPWNDQLSSDDDNKNNSLRTQKPENSTDVLHLEYPWNGQSSPDNENKTEALRTQKSEDFTKELHLEFPWNDQLKAGNDNKNNALRAQNLDDFTNLLHLEYPWNGQQRPDYENNLLTSKSYLRKLNTNLRRREDKYIAREYTDVVDLEFPWNDHTNPEGIKHKLRSGGKPDKGKDLNNHNIVLEHPWNGDISQDEDNVGEEVVKHSVQHPKNKLRSHLHQRNKRPGHNSRNTYYDDSDDLINRRALIETVKNLEHKYDDLKKVVLELPWQKILESMKENIDNDAVPRIESRFSDNSQIHNQLTRPEDLNYNRSVQEEEYIEHETCNPASQENFEKIMFKYKNSDEDENSSDSIKFPLDRRPVARLAAHHKDVYADRRLNSLLEPMDKPSDPLFNTTNDVESELNNDTVNHVFVLD